MLAPIYLISGIDPDQISNSCNKIITQAKEQGYTIVNQDTLPDNNLSLFSNKQLIKITHYNGINASNTSAIIAWCKQPPCPDTIVLIAIYGVEQLNKLTKLTTVINKSGTTIITKNLDSSATKLSAFALTAAIKQRNGVALTRTLESLQQENIAPTLVLWVLLKELRRTKNYRLIQQAQRIDSNIKGIDTELTWHRLQILCLGLICKK